MQIKEKGSRGIKNAVEQTINSTATAIAKVLNSPSQITHIQQTVRPQVSPSQNQPCLDRTIGLSPRRAVEIRGKYFQPLALKKLFIDDILTEQELQEQKSGILGTSVSCLKILVPFVNPIISLCIFI